MPLPKYANFIQVKVFYRVSMSDILNILGGYDDCFVVLVTQVN